MVEIRDGQHRVVRELPDDGPPVIGKVLLPVDADTQGLVRTLRIVAKHLSALADELEGDH